MQDEGHAMPALESHILRSAIGQGELVFCRPVVRGENDQRFVRHAGFLQRLHHLAEAPVQLLNHIATHATLG